MFMCTFINLIVTHIFLMSMYSATSCLPLSLLQLETILVQIGLSIKFPSKKCVVADLNSCSEPEIKNPKQIYHLSEMEAWQTMIY